jgi:hypothetical protein
MLKYALTGHTQGIGKGLFERLSPNVIGFSKSTGYDITRPDDRRRIVAESAECDVFINNAHRPYSQTWIFIMLVNEWKDREDKTIINVGSRITDLIMPNDSLNLLEYQASKLILKEMTFKVPNVKCKIKYKSFGYVGTEAILTKYPHFTEKDYISIDEACDIILS